jgi:hypothetical protein
LKLKVPLEPDITVLNNYQKQIIFHQSLKLRNQEMANGTAAIWVMTSKELHPKPLKRVLVTE